MGTCDRKIAERRLKDWVGSLDKVDAEVKKTTLSQLVGRYLVVTGSMSESSQVTGVAPIRFAPCSSSGGHREQHI